MRERICGVLKKQRAHLWAWVLFGIYFLLLIWVVIFKMEIGLPYVRSSRVVNLIPFYFRGSGFGLSFDAVANFLVFIPLGVYLGLGKARVWQGVVCGLALSLLFELTQFIFKIGVVDITDIITNTAGGAAGVFIYWLLRKICRGKKTNCDTSDKRLDLVIKISASVATGVAFLVFFVFFAESVIWKIRFFSK